MKFKVILYTVITFDYTYFIKIYQFAEKSLFMFSWSYFLRMIKINLNYDMYRKLNLPMGFIEKLAVSRSQVTFKHDKIDEKALVHTIEKFFFNPIKLMIL